MSKGIYYALLTASISGFSIFFAKIFVSKMDPVIFTTLKNLIVAAVLTALVATPVIKKGFASLTRSDWSKLVAVGIIGGSIPFVLFFTGLTLTTAPGAAIIHKTLFIWIAVLAIVFLKEKLNIVQMVGYVLIMWGAFWVAGLRNITFGTGEWMILAATLLWAVENVIAKRTLKTVPFQIVAWARMFIGTIVLIGIVAVQGKTTGLFTLNSQQLQAVIIGAVFLTGYVLTWYKALSYAPATVVSVVLTLSTLVTGALTAIFISHTFPEVQLTSSLLIALGVSLVIYISLSKTYLLKTSS